MSDPAASPATASHWAPATTVSLDRSWFGAAERVALRHGDLTATVFRYPSGVEAVRLGNPRGTVTVLPFMGQMVWAARFDGVDLGMTSMFAQPRPAGTITETYGCLAYHAGLLRNGVPGPGDDHALHGEMPCMAMDEAGLACGTDADGPYLAVTGLRDYAVGFGAHYRASPRVVLRADTAVAVTMEAVNLSAAPMDLMYIFHPNFAFVEGGRIVQPVPFDPAHVVTRTAVPRHVTPTPAYNARLAALAADPARMERLDEPGAYDPEQVFYIHGLAPDADGLVHFLLERPAGDAFRVAYDPRAMPHCVRWIYNNGDQRTVAFALPGTCEPEGYTAERRKNNVRSLAPGAGVAFTTHLGYLDRGAAAAMARRIAGAGER